MAMGYHLLNVYEERHCDHCDRPVFTEPDGVLCPVCGEELRISEGAA